MAFWGSEESGVASEQFLGGAEQGPKDLDLLWMTLNLDGSNTGNPVWSQTNSLLVDEVRQNTTPQPFSVVPAPPYSLPGDTQDAFLLQLIGILEALASRSDNFASSIKSLRLDKGIPGAKAQWFVDRAREVCDKLRVLVLCGKGTYNPDYVNTVSRLLLPVPHDEGLDPIDDRSMKQISCIFCEKKVKSTFKVIQQNSELIAFSSNPSSPVHVLCIPHFHVRDCTFFRQKDIPWLKDLEAYGLDAYRKACRALGISVDHPYRHGFHVPPSTTVNHLHMHITALPGPDIAKLFTVAEKKHLDWHHTPAPVHARSATYNNRLENLLGDGEVTLVAHTGALYILASDLFEVLQAGQRVEARALKSDYREDIAQIVVTRVPV